MLAQVFDRGVGQLGWGSPKGDDAEDAGRADDMPYLLRIVELRKKVSGKQRFCRGLYSAAALPPDADSGSESLDFRAPRQIHGRDVLTPTLGPEAEPAKAAGVEQRTK